MNLFLLYHGFIKQTGDEKFADFSEISIITGGTDKK